MSRPLRARWIEPLTLAVGAFLSLASLPSSAQQQPPQPQPLATAAKPAGFDLPERDFQGLLAERPSDEWMVRQLKGDPSVVVIQFPSLALQGQTLNRVAALLEKSGASRTQVLSDAELDHLIRAGGDSPSTFYLGHDYTAPDLARFFNAAATQHVQLNIQEQGLRSLLQQIGMFAADPTGHFSAPGVAALVTFSALSSGAGHPPGEAMDPQRRASILSHELSHGVYFTRAAYRNYCHRFWHEQLTGAERAVWRRYLLGLNYDGANEDLLINETQALLMHTSDRRDFSAASLGVSEMEIESMRKRFILGAAEGVR